MMATIKKSLNRTGVILIFLVLMSWHVCLSPVEGYTPVDDLISSVNQLHQSNEIFDDSIKTNLISSLQAIGTLIDSGDIVTARELLTAFIQEIASMDGVFITSNGVNRLINEANHVASTL